MFENILKNRESTDRDMFLHSLKWEEAEIDGCFLDHTEAYTPPLFSLMLNGVPFAPMGDIQFLSGQTGHGKTFTFIQLISVLLGARFGGLTYALREHVEKPVVLYIDTEQAKASTQLVKQRVYALLGWKEGEDHSRQFPIMMLRETTSAYERWRKVIKAIDVIRPHFVFLDGLIDVVDDFNSNEQCAELIDQCMALTSRYRISLWCVLHENPISLDMAKKGNGKPIGHLGSALLRKASDSLRTYKERSEGGSVNFTVFQGKVRNKDHDDWTYHIEENEQGTAIPVWNDPVQAADMQAITRQDIEMWVRGIAGSVQWPATAMEVKEQLKLVSGRTDNNLLQMFVSEAKQMGLLVEQTREEMEKGQKHAKLKYVGGSNNCLDDAEEDDPF